ncbi:DNA-3-methyladenine glycosylase [Dyadobacter sp. Leaf189]|uniref:DNA-3-methyladenine glycosylase n=1 Tax=Dyadobacter sp. Leaf189 TaxID=1736295 RepID=UPI0006F617E0|nr:DNA-3-methyladenine glycosylase [Dyadobacter sp. Leaf189]KQS26757.1 3-methyladenine DNA glycosylase [Dyadobacter sp. Leaf189]
MAGTRLPLSFYQSYDTRTLAQKLLGCELVHESAEGTTSGIIVETEAYLSDDPACHAYNRRTSRTEPMYQPAGTIYVYLIYGMYQCFNVVSNDAGIGEAVLIRALEPRQGVDLMQQRRQEIRGKAGITFKTKPVSLKELCRGPGKLVKAMGIDRALHNNLTLDYETIYIIAADNEELSVVTTTRIGINVGAELPLRYYLRDNSFVSKP